MEPTHDLNTPPADFVVHAPTTPVKQVLPESDAPQLDEPQLDEPQRAQTIPSPAVTLEAALLTGMIISSCLFAGMFAFYILYPAVTTVVGN
jgi:hypothetical protein